MEIALWKIVEDLLDESGWCAALSEAGVGTIGTADSFLNVSHLTRTHLAHQVTAMSFLHSKVMPWKQCATQQMKTQLLNTGKIGLFRIFQRLNYVIKFCTLNCPHICPITQRKELFSLLRCPGGTDTLLFALDPRTTRSHESPSTWNERWVQKQQDVHKYETKVLEHASWPSARSK